ncbi:hypothetical protein NHX12_012201 [Muraenolepis orangiensis]|uniref:Uncharacterized protein n=1 Tax=Muraenolepis orangiensis TaxID=630683 RepID=A0A9Q0I3T4_9TELE|nr:hypothetical protein NHX12_012201 [Muraenolepis orangiensis]
MSRLTEERDPVIGQILELIQPTIATGDPATGDLDRLSSDTSLGSDVTEANSSDSRGERLDFFLKQEEAAAAVSGYPGPDQSEEAGGGGGGAAASVANLKAALMSKNSLLSLRAEMLGDDNPLLYEYLPKGAHSLTCE